MVSCADPTTHPKQITRFIADLASQATDHSLEIYKKNAIHRQHPQTQFVFPANRSLLAIPGMGDFPYGPGFINPLLSDFKVTPFDYNQPSHNRFRPWPSNAARIIRALLDGTLKLNEEPVIVGHSAGGCINYLLAVIAKSTEGELPKVLHGINDLLSPYLHKPLSLGEIHKLREVLAGGIFITIGSTLNGLELTDLGEKANERLIKSAVNLRELTCHYLQDIYVNKLGRFPNKVIDGILIGTSRKLFLSGSFASKASTLVVHGGMMACSSFVKLPSHMEKDRERYEIEMTDGVVPFLSALLVGPAKRIIGLNHLGLAEEEHAGEELLSLVKEIQDHRRTQRQLQSRLELRNAG